MNTDAPLKKKPDPADADKEAVLEAMEALTYLSTPAHLRPWQIESQFDQARVLAVVKGLQRVLIGPDLEVIEDAIDRIDDLVVLVEEGLDHIPSYRFVVAALEEAKNQLSSHVDGTWKEPPIRREWPDCAPTPPPAGEPVPGWMTPTSVAAKPFSVAEACAELEAKLSRRHGFVSRVVAGCMLDGRSCFEAWVPDETVIHPLLREALQNESKLPIVWVSKPYDEIFPQPTTTPKE